MQISVKWVLNLAVFTMFAMNSAAFAATVELRSNPEMGCFATLAGVIEKGDAEKVLGLVPRRETLRSSDYSMPRHGTRLCLDSPGGSLVEAVEIADILRENLIGTAVGAGANCESACAVAFMGGFYSTETDIGDQADRIIHPTARLGFHSPSLTVSEGQYSEQAVNQSYALALQSLGQVVQRLQRLELAVPIVETMLSTPPDQMSYVETVGQASIFGIAVAPVPLPKPDAAALKWACVNVEAQNQQMRPYEADNDLDFREITTNADEVFATSDGGFRQELATDCEVYLTTNTAAQTDPAGYVTIGDIRQVYPYQFYPMETRLDQLTKAAAPVQAETGGACFVISGAKIVDQEPCRVIRSSGAEANVYRFTWPSGAVTVVKEPFSRAHSELNGVLTRRETSSDAKFLFLSAQLRKSMADPKQAWSCWKNPSSGNYFCFVDGRTDGSSVLD